MQVTAGPDGFLTTSGDPDYALNVVLTDYLHAAQERRRQGARQRRCRGLRKELSKRDLVRLIGVIHRRLAWIEQHEHELAEPRRWQRLLSRLAKRLYSPKLPFAAADLVAESSRRTGRHARCGGSGPKNSWSPLPRPTICRRNSRAELRQLPGRAQGQVPEPGGLPGRRAARAYAAVARRERSDRSEALLERDDPARPARDDRAGSGLDWRALVPPHQGERPGKATEGLAERSGEAARRGRRAGIPRPPGMPGSRRSSASQPQPLSVPGSHVLRGLLWYAALIDNPALATDLADAARRQVEGQAKRREDDGRRWSACWSRQQPEVQWPPLQRLQLNGERPAARSRTCSGRLRRTRHRRRRSARARLVEDAARVWRLLDKMMERLQSARFAVGIADPQPVDHAAATDRHAPAIAPAAASA